MAGIMEMSGERRICAPRARVWQALNDPLVLKASIPGCERLDKLSDTEMTMTISMKIGPVAARFNGKLTLSEIDPPSFCRMAGEGQGGVAGFAKGGADVRLTEDGEATVLSYDAKAQVGGKLAQLGARLIDASARHMADAFFTRFAELLAPPVAGEAVAEEPAAEAPAVVRPDAVAAPARKKITLRAIIMSEPLGYPLAAWVIGVFCLIVLALVVLRGGDF